MGNCLSEPELSEETSKYLDSVKRSDSRYEIKFYFKDLENIEILDTLENEVNYYIAILVFAKHNFVNCYVYKQIKNGNDFYYEEISIDKNIYFIKKQYTILGFYYNINYTKIYPSGEFLKKVNDKIIWEIYEKIIQRTI